MRSDLRSQVAHPNKLHVYDSLSKSVREFVPSSDTVKWYSCGPTVYDASHMGHARNYVTTDILRRIMSDYFGYKVNYVQNVTDVDDKIIVKARHNLLFDQYKQKHPDWRSQKEAIAEWWKAYRAKNLYGLGEIKDWAKNLPAPRDLNAHPKDQMVIDTLSNAAVALQSEDITADGFYAKVRDIVVFGIDNDNVSNEEISKASSELTTYWEGKFNEDMANLNVRTPDKVVRVTEFMDAIVQFVGSIIDNGFAYEVNGSVYFNVSHFVASGHDYAKLKPTSMSAATDALLAEAEGSLSNTISQSKKSQRDFALWKASKSGEPYWPSPWGNGRPGWHIECSAMASSVFGSAMDIHSGGEDLTFPHHDNELAQSEAYHGCHEWVRYFLHTGHLHIHGMKMSKSLKNFITIEEALTSEGMTSRLMRLLFLSGKWRGRVDYNDDLIKGVRTIDQKFSEFFTQMRALKGDEKEDAILAQKLQETRSSVDAALADDFDTPRMLVALRELLVESNKSLTDPAATTLLQVTAFFTDLFEVLGIEAADDRIGWTQSKHNDQILTEVHQIAELRHQIREAKGHNVDNLVTAIKSLSLTTPELITFQSEVSTNSVLTKLDEFRDYTLVDLGIALDDKKDGFIIKPSSRGALLAKRQQREAETQRKEELKADQKRRDLETLEKGRVRAADMFRSRAEYTRFDEHGVPTHCIVDGVESVITKSQVKKLLKEQTAQKKLNLKYDDAYAK